MCHGCLVPLIFVATVTLLKVAGTWGLSNVTLLISPPVVERGKDVELLCKYDLQGAPLYSLRFYRGVHEFYRYSPMDIPQVKLFPFPGLHVDLSLSKDNAVFLQGVDYSMAGNISCEVSTDGPLFSTKTTTKSLSVVELPKTPPEIRAEMSRELVAGERLQATCTSSPARPAPILSWFINDEPARSSATRLLQRGSMETRMETLDTRLLPRHLRGPVILKCSAFVEDIYSETSNFILYPEVHEPKHERVRSSSPSSMSTAIKISEALLIASMIFSLLPR